jgi:hypothetical protein
MEEEQRPRGEHRGRKETASGALQQREGKREKRKEKSEPKADGKKIRLESAASITPGQQVEMKQSADASRAHAAVEGEKDSSSCRTKIYSKSQSDKDRGKAERKKSSAVKEDGATTLANMEPADGQKSTTTSTNHQKQKRSAADNTDHQEKKDRKSSTVDEKHANADDEVSRKTKKKTPTVAHEPERKIVDKVDPPQRRRSLRGRSQESKAIVPATGAENQQSTLPIHLEEKRLYKAQQQEGAKVRSKTAASEPLKTQPPSERTSSRQESKTDKHRSSDQMRKAAPAEEREKVEKYADSIPRISGGKRGEDRQESSSRERKGGNVSEPGKSIASKLKSSQGDTRAKREKSAESEVQNLTEKRTSKKRKPVPETTDSRQPESSQPKSSTASKWKSSEGPPRVQRQTNSEVETRTESRSSKKQNAAPETTESTQPRSSQPKPTAKKRRTSVAKESVVKAVHEEQTEAKRKKPSTSKRGDTGEKVEMKKDIGTKKYQADHGVDILGDSGHGVEAKKIDVHRESGTHRKSAISQQVNGADEGKMKTYQKKQPSGSTVATEEVVAEAYQTRSAPDDGASKKRRRKRRKDNSAGDSAQEAHSQITMVDVQRASSKPSSIPTSQPSSLEDCVASPVVPHNGAAGTLIARRRLLMILTFSHYCGTYCTQAQQHSRPLCWKGSCPRHKRTFSPRSIVSCKFVLLLIVPLRYELVRLRAISSQFHGNFAPALVVTGSR